MRCLEPNWWLVAMHDPSGRRGVWYRISPNKIELCAGREGDDDYLSLSEGQVLTEDDLKALEDIMSRGHWALEMAVDNDVVDLHGHCLHSTVVDITLKQIQKVWCDENPSPQTIEELIDWAKQWGSSQLYRVLDEDGKVVYDPHN